MNALSGTPAGENISCLHAATVIGNDYHYRNHGLSFTYNLLKIHNRKQVLLGFSV
jgi:hypothetical protein